MSASTKEYDLYLPLHYNDGQPVEPEKIRSCKQRLTDAFGGLTHFPQENEGLWKVGPTTFRDKVIILRVLATDCEFARKFLGKLRAELESEFRQASILIVEREVAILE